MAAAFIAAGTETVVAAGSVVIRDVPPHTLVRGNPAEDVKALRREVDGRAGNILRKCAFFF